MRTVAVVLTLSVCAPGGAPAFAQQPAEPRDWTVAASAGLAITSGNTDTSTFNAAYDLVYDPKTRNVVKSDGLMIRGKTEDVVSANRVGLRIRDEFTIHTRTFLFGQHQYLRDEFKNIDYLMAPTAGIGFKVVDTMQTRFALDAGIGGVWEKNPGLDVRSSGAVTLGEKITHTLTSTTTLTQTFTGLWKTKDLDDSLYTFGAGIAVAISSRTQLKVEALDVFKSKPPARLPPVEKNDVAVLMAIVYKM